MEKRTIVQKTFERLLKTRCVYEFVTTRKPSHFALLFEYWRRLHLWGQVVPFDEWKFVDVAREIDPNIHADEEKLEQLMNHARENSFPAVHRLLFRCILNWATLKEKGGTERYDISLDPFEPLIRLYERDGAFGKDHSGFYVLGGAMWQIPPLEKVLEAPPLLDMSDEALNEIDKTRAGKKK